MAAMNTQGCCDTAFWMCYRKNWMNTSTTGTLTLFVLFGSQIAHLEDQRQCTFCLTGVYCKHVKQVQLDNLILHLHHAFMEKTLIVHKFNMFEMVKVWNNAYTALDCQFFSKI